MMIITFFLLRWYMRVQGPMGRTTGGVQEYFTHQMAPEKVGGIACDLVDVSEVSGTLFGV